MRVEVSSEAAEFVRAHGGRLWGWAATPPVATTAPLEIWFRAPGGRCPDVLEIGLAGRRRARVEAYWDGCLTMM